MDFDHIEKDQHQRDVNYVPHIAKTNIIAIDGPSASGKSSLAHALAVSLNYGYLETGAMYRAAALYVLDNHVPITHIPEIIELISDIPLDISLDPDNRSVFLHKHDVTDQLRSAKVTAVVSAVSAIAEVRKKLVAMQRKLAAGCHSIVVEGRDIGTIVFPNAQIKFFLTASVHARAIRRAAQLGNVSVQEVESELARRDKLDSSRIASPLKPAHDAIIIDNSDLTQDQTLTCMLSAISDRYNPTGEII